MKDIRGKTAFVTGAANGIGLGIVRALLAADAKVVLADRSAVHLQTADTYLRTLGYSHYRCIQVDVTDRAAMQRAADEAEATFGHVHILCNNAGIGGGVAMSRAEYADWDRMLSVNLGGVVNGVVTFLPRLRAHGEDAHIVNTSSIAGILALSDDGGIYTASKFAVRGLSESLRLALAPDGIGVSLLCPGLTRSQMLEEAREASEAAGDGRAESFAQVQQFAMDPLIVGEAVLAGIQRNDAYILPHGEFVDEVQAMHADIVRHFRTDLPIDPRRAAFEQLRRQSIEQLKHLGAKEA